MNRQFFPRIVLACFLFLAAAGAPAQAAPSSTFIITSLSETADISPGNGICMDSGGLCTLKAAVMEANALAGADVITMMAGTYNLTGTLPVTGNLTINGVTAATTILDGPGTLGVRGFDVNPEVDFVLNDVTLRDFMGAIHVSGNQLNTGTITLQDSVLRDNLSTDPNNSGSAILLYCLGCSVTLRNTAVYNNAARSCGAISSRGNLLIEQGSTVHHNQATVSAGGAICNSGGALAVNNSSIYSNSAAGDGNNFGGAIMQSDGTTAISLGDLFSNSATDAGGAIYLGGGSLYINNTQISGNQATSGGGLYLFGDAQASLSAVSIVENMANYGGGIHIGMDLAISYSDIISNTASIDGAGLYIQEDTTTILNSTFSGNRADRNGAGLYTKNTATLNLGNVTVANNTADADDNGDGMGGGIYRNAGTVLLRNSVVAKNVDLTETQLEMYAPDCYGSITSDGYNLVGMRTALCTVSGNMSGVSIGTSSPGLDPKLLPLTKGIYATYHHPLQMGPLVDGGNPAGCLAFNNAVLLQDQLGEARIYGIGLANYHPRCDLGAVESSLKAKIVFLPLVRK